MIQFPNGGATVSDFDNIFKKIAEVKPEIRTIYRAVAHHAFFQNESVASVICRAQIWTVRPSLVTTNL